LAAGPATAQGAKPDERQDGRGPEEWSFSHKAIFSQGLWVRQLNDVEFPQARSFLCWRSDNP
jgi:hypothetical protein